MYRGILLAAPTSALQNADIAIAVMSGKTPIKMYNTGKQH